MQRVVFSHLVLNADEDEMLVDGSVSLPSSSNIENPTLSSWDRKLPPSLVGDLESSPVKTSPKNSPKKSPKKISSPETSPSKVSFHKLHTVIYHPWGLATKIVL